MKSLPVATIDKNAASMIYKYYNEKAIDESKEEWKSMYINMYDLLKMFVNIQFLPTEMPLEVWQKSYKEPTHEQMNRLLAELERVMISNLIQTSIAHDNIIRIGND